MMIKRAFLLLLLVFAVVVSAQDISPPPVNPNALVSWPPPVYVLRGEFTIRGTANVPNMANYFIEFRQLPEPGSAPDDEDDIWFPATLPAQRPVIEDVLGVWNTLTAPDGLYEMRLTINISGGAPVFASVSPLRIENNPPPFAQIDLTPLVTPQPTTAGGQSRPTLQPTPTALDTTARVVVLTDANVRSGDGVVYDVVGTLLAGESAQVIALSSLNTGWYYIQLPNGKRGWIAPSVVRAEGNTAALPRLNPPPPPTPIASPTPLITAVPVVDANLQISGLQLAPLVPTCNEAFNVFINIVNSGTQSTLSGGSVLVQDTHTATGALTASGGATFPILSAGQNFVVVVPMTSNVFYNDQHTITARVDAGNQVGETNENDNVFTTTYTLQKGACP